MVVWPFPSTRRLHLSRYLSCLVFLPCPILIEPRGLFRRRDPTIPVRSGRRRACAGSPHVPLLRTPAARRVWFVLICHPERSEESRAHGASPAPFQPGHDLGDAGRMLAVEAQSVQRPWRSAGNADGVGFGPAVVALDPSLRSGRVPLLACPAVRSGYTALTAGRASSGTLPKKSFHG